LLRFLAGLVAVFVLAELGVRAVSSRLDEPLEYYTPFAQQMVTEMEALESAGRDSDLLFVGTSMVQLGINVAPFEARLESVEAGHKAALPGGQPALMELWLRDEVLPRLNPRRVVWGVSSLDFNGKRPEPMVEVYQEGRAARVGVLANLDRFLARHLYLVRYREQLRDPIGLAHDLADGSRPAAQPDDLESFLSDQPTPRAARTQPILDEIQGIALHEYEVGANEVRAFRDTVDLIRQSGAEVVVVVMPVPTEYVAAHPQGDADYAEFRSALDRVTGELGVPVLDYGREYLSDAFADYTHLTPDWSLRFSTVLAEKLSAMGW
jgi:hypothetical protein